jgi:hypothetical protein
MIAYRTIDPSLDNRKDVFQQALQVRRTTQSKQYTVLLIKNLLAQFSSNVVNFVFLSSQLI